VTPQPVAVEFEAPLLELHGVTKRFGELTAVDNVSLEVARGSRHALIGPNGAGKSTLFHLITGTLRSSDGRIVFAGHTVTRTAEHRRTRLGIGRTFQHTSLFDGLTALENVELAVQQQARVAWRVLPSRRSHSIHERSLELLERVRLGDRAGARVGALAYGERRELEVALALATKPTLLLMDEPTAGMSREDGNAFLEMVSQLPESLTILLVEHDMDVVFGVATWISVLDAGKLIANGTQESIRASAEVQDAYLGRGERLEHLFETA